jgi:hypothetical protein
MAKKGIVKKVTDRVKSDNERGARNGLIEDLFYDFHRSRAEVYKMNFIRGLFFGFGSVLGGTVIIALLAWSLSLFVDIPGIGESIQEIQRTIQQSKEK